MSTSALHKVLILSIVALGWMPVAVFAADAALERASTAMGAGELKSIRYAGDGIGYTFGQAYKPGLPWPKIRVHSFVRSVNYDTGSMKDEIVLSRAEGLGGGGYPHVAQQRNEQYVSGAYARLPERRRRVGVSVPRFLPDRRVVANRRLDDALRRNPQLVDAVGDIARPRRGSRGRLVPGIRAAYVLLVALLRDMWIAAAAEPFGAG